MTPLEQRLGERIVRAVVPSGLGVSVLPKPGFHKTEVHLAVAFGSIDEDGGAVYPQGTAHFLEHMLFENEEADPSAAFARLGASVNAYTSADVTDYYFSTTEAWQPAADLLVRLVCEPSLPAARVAKEREIIAREIQMTEDDVNVLIYEELLNALYVSHPVRSPIAGTVEAIRKIDEAVLRAAHAARYVPAAMRLVVVGDVDPEEVIRFAAAHPAFAAGAPAPIRRRRPEPAVPARSSIRRRKDVKNDMVMLGIKLPRPEGVTQLAGDLDEIAFAFLFDGLFGKASPGYQELVRKGFVNEGFDATAQCEPDYGHLLVYTETKKPEAALKAIRGVLATAAERLDAVRFETAKRRLLGNYVTSFNSVSALAGLILDYELAGIDVFRLIEAIDALTLADLRRLVPLLDPAAEAVVLYHR